MQHRAATICSVGLAMMGFCVASAFAEGFFYGGPLVFEDVAYANVGVSGGKQIGNDGLQAVFGFSGYGGHGVGGFLVSANGAYYFPLNNQKFESFGTAGVSAIAIYSSEAGGTAGPNFGGGLTYWFKENRGIRGEYRVHIYPDVPRVSHEIRFGFVWKK